MRTIFLPTVLVACLTEAAAVAGDRKLARKDLEAAAGLFGRLRASNEEAEAQQRLESLRNAE